MAAPRSTKYRRIAASPAEAVRRFVQALPGRSRRPLLAVLERVLFGVPAAPGRWLRAIARRLNRQNLEAGAEAFEADFYLAQIEDAAERAYAGLDPQLHYVGIGRWRLRSPARAFDPVHYRRHARGLPTLTDPFAHYLRIGRALGHAPNAVDGIRTGAGAGGESVLVVDHPRGGGSSRYIQLFEARIRAGGRGVIRLRHVAGTGRLALWDDLDRAADAAAPPPVFDLFADEDALVATARAARVSRILVNHVIDRPVEIFDWIGRVAGRIGCAFDIVLHDFYVVCPRVNAVGGDGRFCGLAPVETCRVCIATYGSERGGVDPVVWRRATLGCLAAADRIFVPSQDTAARLAPFLAGRVPTVWEPEEDTGHPPDARPPGLPAPHGPLRVVLIGALNVPKGSRVLLDLAREVRRRALPVTFTLIGPSDDTAALTAQGVAVQGRYDAGELDRLIAAAAPDLVLLPAIWPETWSFVLSHALARGLPVAVFDIGAPAERLRRLGRGHILPLALAEDPAGLAAALLALRDPGESAAA